jgi:hypothetical protein
VTLGRLAVLFGTLELAFVLLVAGLLPTAAFVIWGSACCLALIVLGRRSA